MKISRVRLKNGYKRFHDLTIDLGESPARIIALVGPNGCGKSSVLDGLLYHTQTQYYVGSNAGRDHNYHSMTGSASLSRYDVEILFTEGTFAEVFQRIQVTGNPRTIFSFRSPYRYNSVLKVNETRAVEDIKQNTYGAGDTASLDAKMEENYRRLSAFFNKFRDQNDMRPSEAMAKILGDLNSSIRNCLDIEIHSLGNVEGGKGTLYFKKPDHPIEFEFNVLSSGEKEVIDLLLDLYLRKDDYTNSIFLIDEPELHVHTSVQGKLLAEIDRLVGEDCQIWITTHSIGFLRKLQQMTSGKCQIIHMRPELNLASEAHVLTPVRVGPGTWRELFAVALDDLAHMVSPSKIVYCEGRAEPGFAGRERGLDAKVYNTIFAASHPDSMFTSSGGNTEQDQRSAVALAVLGKVFPSVDIYVLKDRDFASGKPTTEQDRLHYLATNSVSHRVLRRWEIENYLFDKEVLKAYCDANGLLFNEPAYDVFVTDIYNQNVKDEVGRIKNFCGISHSINPETFKVELSRHIVPSMSVFQELSDCIFERK